MNTLDLTAEKRPTIKIIIPNVRKFVFRKKLKLDVFTPSKLTRESFTLLGETLTKIAKNEATAEDIDALYRVTADILSRNKQNITIDKEHLERHLDTTDIILILKEYADFLKQTIESKN